jgi:YesN/AraC family two-component response regulator
MPYNILLVDDDTAFREEFAECFEDYCFIEAGNGEEALKILRKPNEIDLVILDVKMPGRRGTDVLREIKRIEPSLGVIILTGFSSKDVAVEALKGNADDYIEKPVDIKKAEKIIADMMLNKTPGQQRFSDDINGKIERVKSFLRRNYHKKVNLKDAAEIVCLSPKYLSRIFKEKTGESFSEYRLRIKIEKAKELLEITGQTVNEISYEMGYKNLESFIRIFKKLEGYTPTEFRDST